MELGNMLFGNSRGAFAITDRTAFEDAFIKLLDVMGEEDPSYPEPFDNDVFSISPYYGGDCECVEDQEHKKGCPCIQPNFVFKPSDFQIQWYKYPFRDSYMNQDYSADMFLFILGVCIASL